MSEKPLYILIREHDKKIRDAQSKKIDNSEAEFLKKNPKANVKYLKYITRFQDQVDYFG